MTGHVIRIQTFTEQGGVDETITLPDGYGAFIQINGVIIAEVNDDGLVISHLPK